MGHKALQHKASDSAPNGNLGTMESTKPWAGRVSHEDGQERDDKGR